MKMRIASLSLLALCVTLAAVPAMAQGNPTVYDNGPVNGEVDAWTINLGFAVSDTFHLSSGATLTGLDFWAWLEPFDTATSVEVAIGTGGYFTNDVMDTTVSLTQSNCFSNNFGLDVCNEHANFFGLNLTLGAGNYYLTLENAATVEGEPVYWDENSGIGCMSNGCPSSAQENTLGTVPSEAFTLSQQVSTTSTSSTSTPESSSIMLFGSGILGLAGVLRRKLF
jgi:hypothetical protein